MILRGVNSSCIFKAYLIIGFLFFGDILFAQNQNKADSLIKLLESSEKFTDSLKLEILKEVFVNHTNQDLRLKYAQEAFQIAAKSNNVLWLHRSTLNMGQAYRKKGDLKKSLNSFFKSAKYAKELSYKKGEAAVNTAIGDVYATEGNHKNALRYYNLGIVNFRELNDSINLAKSLLNTGDFYLTIDQLDSALHYFEESGKIFDLKNYEIGVAYNQGNIGLVYAELGKHQLAEQYILESTKILEALGDNYPISVFHISMADIYMSKSNFTKALEYAHTSYSLAKKNGFKEQIRDASQKLSELYESNQEYKKAFLFQEEYLAYRDSINSEETVREMADLRTEYEVSQKQIEVDLLHQEKKISKIIKFALLGLVFAIGGLAFVYIKRNKEKQLSNILLTKQKQQIEIQHNELEVLNKTKDKFFSIISHDLRGPVSAFKGLTTIMKMSLDDKKYDELPKMAEMLDKSSNQLSSLLNNLLAWAVNQQGGFPYHPLKLHVKNIFEEVAESVNAIAVEKRIAIKHNATEELVIWADNESVKTLLRNLISNALKFTASGGKIELSAIKKDGFVALKVSDNGVGIAKEKLEGIFTTTELKSSVGTGGEKGLGLGLRLAYDFAKMNKGRMSVESELGVGTTFIILLPLSS